MLGVEDSGPFPGRHASRVEIAAETPIFHSLTVGGWRSRQIEPAAPARPSRRAPDTGHEFRRDPLDAPLPHPSDPAMSASASAGGRHGAHALPEPASTSTSVSDTGRHHRYAAAMRTGAAFGW